MIYLQKGNYVLFGNPVQHSKSPIIYHLFAQQVNLDFCYNIQNVENNSFYKVIDIFFKSRGLGANITVPFKKKAYNFAHLLTKRAYISGAVNTLKMMENKQILGDNTDGIGLLYDLRRLNYINAGFHILVIGSGGAARGIIPYLLYSNCFVYVLNRTVENANNIVSCFQHLGFIKVIELCQLNRVRYNLVIHTTSFVTHKNDDFFIPSMSFDSNKTSFYDICYSDDLTFFLKWCKNLGARCYSDGIGMLVSQAAYSFYCWNRILPNIELVINFLNRNKTYRIKK
ncbi:shikimate dehydrogenase [Buchnera aphidicola]|uniref:shikimate dehydrogenase (NADP(+)) n=1 Tax=Buchnera aphidicola (Stegophylla sp.) TaxID=2315800 RepID=A0A4D6YAW3_9GAMM|nr:shikimate dehydrogenase [Buchnera aphidicola (Stegophylla sp.)]QCI26549.1 shikimate dehydrogenase [Buchnera aphidicola (Stegophylla sp.)]